MSENKKSGKWISILIFNLIGIIFILTSIIWDYLLESDSFSQKILISLIGHLGIGAFIIGILTIVVDTNHWTEYFKERLTDIVMDKKYMENLTPSRLIDLQTEIFRVYFKDTNIGNEGGFLKFYQEHIQEIVGSPFRAKVDDDLLIKYVDDLKEKILVHEEMVWYCKSNRGRIQKEVRWICGEDEFETITHFGIKLEHETFSEDSSNSKEKVFEFNDFNPEWKLDEGRSFIFPLSEYETLDGLKITSTVEYTMPWHKFIAWRMAHLTKGLTITIRYPEDLTIAFEIFCRRSYFEVRNNEKGYFKLVTQQWILPNEGVPFQFYRKEDKILKN